MAEGNSITDTESASFGANSCHNTAAFNTEVSGTVIVT
jgi:hypothetical protein